MAGTTRHDQESTVFASARFNIGSNAKSMLASLAATYVQEGRLRWDTKVGEVFAAERPTLNPQLASATLSQLLSHRSGLPAFSSGNELSAVEVEAGTPGEQRLSFALQVLRAPPRNPSKTALYSNAGYIVAGAMIERVGGRSFEQLMQERLFAPLGISATFGTSLPAVGEPWGHVRTPSGLQVHDHSRAVIPPFLQPAGDVSLSLKDYGLFLQEHLCGLRGRDGKVLKAATVVALHQATQGQDTALGWGKFKLNGQQASVHTGGTGTFSAYMAVIPDLDLAAATVTNSGDPEAGRTAMQLLLRLAEVQAGPSLN
jgi:CubicO group peptidase (beta-lactamase class C family)